MRSKKKFSKGLVDILQGRRRGTANVKCTTLSRCSRGSNMLSYLCLLSQLKETSLTLLHFVLSFPLSFLFSRLYHFLLACFHSLSLHSKISAPFPRLSFVKCISSCIYDPGKSARSNLTTAFLAPMRYLIKDSHISPRPLTPIPNILLYRVSGTDA